MTVSTEFPCHFAMLADADVYTIGTSVQRSNVGESERVKE